ncbi:hypothetical protein BDR26DRAFT_894771 [Obelidium mucronatum]|nr:hypothetical protein BDR26DRAFT_894771 [Obelidium mucronatum]
MTLAMDVSSNWSFQNQENSATMMIPTTKKKQEMNKVLIPVSEGTLSNEGSEIDHQQQPLLSHEAAETEQIQGQHDLSENAAEIFTFTIRFIDARWDGKSDLVRVAKLLAAKGP